MHSIIDFIQTNLEAWDEFIFSTIIDIGGVALIIYAVYHLLLIFKDCLATPEKDNYIHGQGDIATDTDTSTSTESDVEETVEHDPTLKPIEGKPATEVEGTTGEIADDMSTDHFNRRIRDAPPESSSNVPLQNVETTSHSSDQNLKQHAKPSSLNETFVLKRSIDENLEEKELFLAGAGDPSCSFISNEYTSDDSFGNAFLDPESGDGILPLDFLNTTQPIAHSSPLRKKTKGDKKD